MAIREYELNSPGAIDPSGFWRFIFWLAFVFGNLTTAFCWLLAHVPGRDMRLNVVTRSCVVFFMLVTILMARWIWKIRNPIPVQERRVRPAMYMVVLVAWVELVL